MARNPIVFNNGTLVSSAKVEVDGVIYDVDPAQYEGTTPLSANNLNQLQTNLYDYVDEEINNVKSEYTESWTGHNLYENNTGTIGNITLSDTIENYKYIEIYVKNRENNFLIPAQRFYTNNEAQVSIQLNLSTNGDGGFNSIGQRCIINGNALTLSYFYNVTTISGSTPRGGTSSNTFMSITKIIGYKEA